MEAETTAATPQVIANSIRLLKSETKPIDKGLVDQFATMTPSVTERPLDESRVDYLGTKVVEGSAIPFLWAYAVLNGVEVPHQRSAFQCCVGADERQHAARPGCPHR